GGDFMGGSDQARINDAKVVYSQTCGGSIDAWSPGGAPPDPSVVMKSESRPAGAPQPSVNSEHFNEDARKATFDGIQQKIDPTRNKAFAEGNTLALWLRKDPKPGAVDAHNEGSAHLKYGDTQIVMVKGQDDMATFGEFAVEAYEAACVSFERG